MAYTAVATAMTAALAGQIADESPHSIRSYIQGEASAEIPLGVMVGQGSTDNEAIKLAAITDKLVGITVLAHVYAKDNELGDTGVKPDVVMAVMDHGVVWVTVEEAVTPASTVLCRAIAAGNEVAGAFRDTADASDLIDCSKWARFLTSTTGAGVALLSFDLRNRAA